MRACGASTIAHDHPHRRRRVRCSRRREEQNRCKQRPSHSTAPLLHRARRLLLRQACWWNPYNREARLILAFLVALAATSAAQAGNGKVLAVKFDADVNPVTQKWLSDRIDEGAKLRRARDPARHAGRARRARCARSCRTSSPRRSRSSSTSRRTARAQRARASGSRRPPTCSRWRRSRTSARRLRSRATGQNIGSDLKRKVVNDAAASLRNLARAHGRNAKWADLAVRKASNLTARGGAEA